MSETVLILDFGSQVTQLIARRLREAGVYCEIHPYDRMDDAAVRAFQPKAVILSGACGGCGRISICMHVGCCDSVGSRAQVPHEPLPRPCPSPLDPPR